MSSQKTILFCNGEWNFALPRHTGITTTETFAATELRNYLARLTGKRPPYSGKQVMNSDLVHESVRQRIEANIGYKPDVAQWPASPLYMGS